MAGPKLDLPYFTRNYYYKLSLYMLGISMGLFQACHVIDFQNDIIKTAKRKQT